ncbi:methylisocitrate lyase [Chthonomonas calidirosea]|uniref:methylisocitrate lyase n=1 Tax=Chthonomonas calidirosea TaxID=454171 RepID=UPI0006EC7E8A|nr:methylisocitrate lyase [Chthonomonas calidirosea]CEK19064.1 methylisocitrate lyase [Chthonomonas calidirosea]
MTLSPGALLRARLQKGLLVLPGVFNAITALLAEQVGFEALYLSGAGVTNSLLGMPDIALITLTEMAQQARYVARAVKLPVIADADTGYGEVLNVARTVEEFEQAGLAGLHLEDQVAPKRCGHLDGKQVIPTEEMVKKIRAAVRARSDPSFFLIARTDARSVNGLEDAIARAKRYLDAGADAIFPESLQSRAEFETFAKAVSAPLLANMTEFGKTPYLRAQEFAEMGYIMVIFPMTAFRVMMHAAREALRTLKETGTQQSLLDRMQTRKELYELLRYADYERLDREIAEGDS